MYIFYIVYKYSKLYYNRYYYIQYCFNFVILYTLLHIRGYMSYLLVIAQVFIMNITYVPTLSPNSSDWMPMKIMKKIRNAKAHRH